MTNPEGDILMSHEVEQGSLIVLGDLAKGTIDPGSRIATGEITQERVDQVAREMSEHYVWLGGELIDTSKLIPVWCVDGRTDEEGLPLAPNAAGGTHSLVVGDALIDAPALIANKQTSASHSKTLFTMLKNNGYEIGSHRDSNANNEKCGCGACDRMGEIFQFITDNIEELSSRAAELDVTIEETLQAKIKTNVDSLIAAQYVSSGPDMIDATNSVAGDDSVQTLKGSHKEVVLAVNTVEGTTFNRRSLTEEFGDDYQAFNLDVWALKNGIDAIATSENEAQEKFSAAVIYNIATACVLAGPSLRVVVR